MPSIFILPDFFVKNQWEYKLVQLFSQAKVAAPS
jgi:hypothetical protein